MRVDRGAQLLLAGVVLFGLTIAVSAAVAPDRGHVGGTAAGESPQTLVGSQGGGAGWHEYGSVYLLNGTDVAWREGSADSYFDVQRLNNGNVLAGFMHNGYERCGPYDSPCARTGYRIIDPDASGGPTVVDEYSFPVRTQKNSEVHDAEPLPGGGFVMTDMDRERIVVVRDEQVVWQWNASSVYDAPADPTTTDWLHVNDVDRIGDGRFLVSVRNANQLVVVQRTADGGSEVVEIINADAAGSSDASCRGGGQLRDTDGDGDVRCGDPDVLNHQHNPQWLGAGAVLVADSDNDRVVELHRGDDGNWSVAWTLTEAAGLELRWPRDADRLPNGNTLITDTLNKRIVEVDENGTVVWRYATERIPYEADRVPRELRGDGLPRMNADGDAAGTPEAGDDTAPEGGVPVLSSLVVLVRAAAPWAPVWFAEPQVAATLVSLALVIAGAVVSVRD
ncbi:hypothetical protein [Halobaculum sp. P14]|uniref:hypothetical protein n=1 Tax=Halobaculum sp. P14 TaxID=3421638 RepID=UPI003EB99058